MLITPVISVNYPILSADCPIPYFFLPELIITIIYLIKLFTNND